MDKAFVLQIQSALPVKQGRADGAWGPLTELALAQSSTIKPSHWDRRTVEANVRSICSRLGLDADFAIRVFTLESDLNVSAVSKTGAVGVAQLTMSAVSQFNLSARPSRLLVSEDRRVPETNMVVGVWYLIWCARAMKIKGSLTHLSASDRAKVYGAYNVGVGSMSDLISSTLSGNPISERFLRALGQQASSLKKGGHLAYLSNVERHVG